MIYRFSRFAIIFFGIGIVAYTISLAFKPDQTFKPDQNSTIYPTTTDHTWNQKMRLYITTPNGPVVAENVIEIFASTSNRPHFFPDASPIHRKVSGDALVYELDSKRYIFAPLSPSETSLFYLQRDTFSDLPQVVGAGRSGDGKSEDWNKFFIALKQHQKEMTVPNYSYPKLISFADINDLDSAFSVDPDNLADSFGPGYSLDKITLQIVDEPITRGMLERAIPCFGHVKSCGFIQIQLPQGRGERHLNISNDNFRVGSGG